MRFYIIIILMLTAYSVRCQDNVPYEDGDNYKFEIDYNFKTKISQGSKEVKLYQQKTTYRSSLLPYVKVLLTMTNMPEDRYRVRVINDLGAKVLTKKLKKNMQIVVDMGYADDIKDRIGAHRYDVYFEDKMKNKVSKIVIDIDEEGNFMVNEQKFGKI